MLSGLLGIDGLADEEGRGEQWRGHVGEADQGRCVHEAESLEAVGLELEASCAFPTTKSNTAALRHHTHKHISEIPLTTISS